jgi:hypothetical protein
MYLIYIYRMQPQMPFSNYPQNMDQTMQIVEPTYDQHIFKPPERNETFGRIPKKLFIDSSDRNCNKYLHPNNYVYELNTEYKDVISIELSQGCIPRTGYIITEDNNKLYLQEQLGETIVITIPVGNYDETTLTPNLEKLINDSPDTQNTYNVNVDPLTRKFNITSSLNNGIFRLLNNCCKCKDLDDTVCKDCDSCEICRKNNCNKYIPDSISKNLGFDKVNFLFARGVVINAEQINATTLRINACGAKFTEDFEPYLGITTGIAFANIIDEFYTISSITDDNTMEVTGNTGVDLNDFRNSLIYANNYTANNIYDLEDAKYIILEIEHLDNLDSNNKDVDNSYGVIFFTVPQNANNVIVNGDLPRLGIQKYFNPPLSTLDRLRIRFLKPDGSLYDFNGRDHALEFEVITLNAPGKYNTLLTT